MIERLSLQSPAKKVTFASSQRKTGQQKGLEGEATAKPPAKEMPRPSAALAKVYFGASDAKTTGDAKEPSSLETLALRSLRENTQQQVRLSRTFSLGEFLNKLGEKPWLAEDAAQRLYSMYVANGRENLYRNPERADDALAGVEVPAGEFFSAIEAAAMGTGERERLIVIVGPPGNGKSSFFRTVKHGLEKFSQTERGQAYRVVWDLHEEPGNAESKAIDLKLENGKSAELPTIFRDPMNSHPLMVLPEKARRQIATQLNHQDMLEYNLNPELGISNASLWIRDRLWQKYTNEAKDQLRAENPNWSNSQVEEQFLANEDLQDAVARKVFSHVLVEPFELSEQDKQGLATFAPKDPKSQDAQELAGEPDWSKAPKTGQYHPLAQLYNGVLNRGNQGVTHFIEGFRLKEEFFFDMFTVIADRVIPGKGISNTPVNTVVIVDTNWENYSKYLKNKEMSALISRVKPVFWPYVTRVSDEVSAQKKRVLGPAQKANLHVNDLAIRVPSLFAVLTRIADPKNQSVSRLQKALALDGKYENGLTEEDVKQMAEDARTDDPAARPDGFSGVDPRKIQTVLSQALIKAKNREYDTTNLEYNGCLDAELALDTLKSQLAEGKITDDPKQRQDYLKLLEAARRELDNAYLEDVMKAVAGDSKALETLWNNYFKDLQKWSEWYNNPSRRNKPCPIDENTVLKPVERYVTDLAETDIPNFRNQLMTKIAGEMGNGGQFKWNSDPRMEKAIVRKLFDDKKSHIDFTQVIFPSDPGKAAEIDAIKGKMTATTNAETGQSKYCSNCASKALARIADSEFTAKIK